MCVLPFCTVRMPPASGTYCFAVGTSNILNCRHPLFGIYSVSHAK